MTGEAYGTLAAVYAWLQPEPMLTPDGSAAAFAGVLAGLPPGARVLDCACGTGQLAVGLARAGFAVAATDLSPAMVEATVRLARECGTPLDVRRCAWDELPEQGWPAAFDAVLCVGNSLAHAPGGDARRAALQAMAGTLRPGGRLAVTSRTWELVRAGGSRFEVGDGLVERAGGRALVMHAWTVPDDWAAPHHVEIAVAVIGDDGGVETTRERLELWPFTHDELAADLAATGLRVEDSTFDGVAGRYLVVARLTTA